MGCSCSKTSNENVALKEIPQKDAEPPVQHAMVDQVQQQAVALYSQISEAVTVIAGQKAEPPTKETAITSPGKASSGITGSVQTLLHDVTASITGASASETVPKKKKNKKKKKGAKNGQGGDASSGGDATPKGLNEVFEEAVEPEIANPEAYYSADSEDVSRIDAVRLDQAAKEAKKSKKATRN